MHTANILALGALALAAFPAPAPAQLANRPVLTLEAARGVVAAASAEARKLNSPGAIVVVDDGGNLVFVERLDGTFPAGTRIATGKARTAALFRRPTKIFEDLVNGGRTSMTALEDFTPLQGGEPLVVAGEVIGAIGVSGALSADADRQVALAGAAWAAALTVSAARSEGSVIHVDHAAVRDAFVKGAVLVDNGRYMVHASHRDGPGQAEVHALDTDIIYVLAGTATLVTGGTVVDPAPVAPGEVRGAAIEQGTVRKLVPGDVVIVPRGTPHWFRDVPVSFDYYVVKSR